MRVESDEERKEEEYRFLKYYHVFNVEQTEGITIPQREEKAPSDIIDEAEGFLSSLGATIIFGKGYAAYQPNLDEILLPHPHTFTSMAAYYATALHEHVHWSGHPSRLNRPLVSHRHVQEYAEEELVAELGAAFLCSHLQIPSRMREDHAAYIQSWIRVLHEDRRAIFKASALAQKAADYLRAKAGEEAV